MRHHRRARANNCSALRTGSSAEVTTSQRTPSDADRWMSASTQRAATFAVQPEGLSWAAAASSETSDGVRERARCRGQTSPCRGPAPRLGAKNRPAGCSSRGQAEVSARSTDYRELRPFTFQPPRADDCVRNSTALNFFFRPLLPEQDSWKGNEGKVRTCAAAAHGNATDDGEASAPQKRLRGKKRSSAPILEIMTYFCTPEAFWASTNKFLVPVNSTLKGPSGSSLSVVPVALIIASQPSTTGAEPTKMAWRFRKLATKKNGHKLTNNSV